MLEVRLQSGPVVAFDGRVLEIFGADIASSRFHIAQLDAPESVETADGSRLLSLRDGSVTLSFARAEAPACDRLLAAIAEARA